MTTSLKQADLRRAQIKNTTDSQKTKRREQKHKTKGNHQTTKGKTEKERERGNRKKIPRNSCKSSSLSGTKCHPVSHQILTPQLLGQLGCSLSCSVQHPYQILLSQDTMI